MTCSRAGRHSLIDCSSSHSPPLTLTYYESKHNFCVFVCFTFTVSLHSAILMSLLTISTEAVFLIAAMFPIQKWSAQVCRLMLLLVLRLGFACTGGTTPRYVVNNHSIFYVKCWDQWNQEGQLFSFFVASHIAVF